MIRFTFWTLLAVIGAVSAYDTYLSIKYQETLLLMEANPIGRWLITLDGGDVALFMTLKMIGTVTVLATLASLYRLRPRLAVPSATGLACFQGGSFAT